jgi:hypothetical protein
MEVAFENLRRNVCREILSELGVVFSVPFLQGLWVPVPKKVSTAQLHANKSAPDE